MQAADGVRTVAPQKSMPPAIDLFAAAEEAIGSSACVCCWCGPRLFIEIPFANFCGGCKNETIGFRNSRIPKMKIFGIRVWFSAGIQDCASMSFHANPQAAAAAFKHNPQEVIVQCGA